MTHVLLLHIMKGGCLAMAGLAFFPTLRRIQTALIGATLGLGIGTLALRSWESWRLGYGHFPSSNLFEAVALLMVFCVGLLFWVGRKTPALIATTALGMLVPLGVFLTYAELKGGADLRPLMPSLNSIWIQIHVPVTVLGYATFAVAGLAGACTLWNMTRGVSSAAYTQATTHLLRLGFPLFSAGIVLGAIWAYTVWGSFWAWDPKETWALITWLYYAAAFHMATNPRRFALWMIAGLPLTLFTFIGVNYVFAGQHQFGLL